MFANKWNFRHVTSSPHYPRSNEMVEKHIQTAKGTLKNAYDEKKDPYLVLLELMDTPLSPVLPSPNQLIQKRNVRGIMPDYIVKNKFDSEQIRSKLKARQDTQKFFHDRKRKDLSTLDVGQNVSIQNQRGTWDPAIIVKKTDNDRSYQIRTKTGNVVSRNRVQKNNIRTV